MWGGGEGGVTSQTKIRKAWCIVFNEFDVWKACSDAFVTKQSQNHYVNVVEPYDLSLLDTPRILFNRHVTVQRDKF